MTQAAVALPCPDEDEYIRAIPRHPADPTIAYGDNLDLDYVKGLVEKRILTAAIFRNAVKPEEIAAHVTPELQRAFREACAHFTHFFVSHEKGITTDRQRGVAVMRGLGYPHQGFGIEDTPLDYQGGKSLRDFLPDEWLIELVRKQGELVALPIRGYGYHIYQAFPGKAKQGYASYWHDHNDIGAHTTLAGAGLEWLPSHIKTKDAATHPEKFEHLIQRVEIGDLIVFGRLPHRSSHAIPEQGQFAVLGQGPFDLRNGD